MDKIDTAYEFSELDLEILMKFQKLDDESKLLIIQKLAASFFNELGGGAA